GERIPLPADGTLALRARWPPASIVHVRERTSGRELDPVLAVQANDWRDDAFAHPPPGAEPKDLGPSPVQLGELEGGVQTATFFVRSPGFAWGKVQIDAALGGERFVELGPCGDVEVVLAGHASDPNTRLRLRAGAGVPVVDAAIDADATAIQIDALPLDKYRVTAE